MSVAPPAARGFIFVTDISGNRVGKYNLDGSVVNASFISGLSQPAGIAVSNDGTTLYVANFGGTDIGKYDAATGAAIDASFISGSSGPDGLALSQDETTLFATNFFTGDLGAYDATTGATIDATLLPTTFSRRSVIATGSHLFVPETNRIAKYTIAGDLVNGSLVTGLNEPSGMSISDDNSTLYVYSAAAPFTRVIGKYNAVTGAAINATLIPGLVRDNFVTGGVTVYGSHLLTMDGNTIRKFTTTGVPVGGPLITGLVEPYNIAVSLVGRVPIFGDIDGDYDLDAADYQFFSSQLYRDVTSLTPADSYPLGDLNADLRIDGRDFVEFRRAFDNANGAGAFQAMAHVLPEPATAAHGAIVAALVFVYAYRPRR